MNPPTVVEIVALALILAVAGIGLWGCIAYVRAAATGRRNEAMDEEYESRPCVECGYDMRASQNRCPECGTLQVNRRQYLNALANDWPEQPTEPRRPGPAESLQILLSTEDAHEASLLQGQLEARGIAVTIEEAAIAGALVSERRSGVFHRVMIYEGDAEAAQAYLGHAQGTGDDL